MFVDDYSRVSWVYLLKDRHHVFDIVKKFFTEIINQFSVTLKNFQTDNTLEFVQKDVESYCASSGIIHQTTCLHTSQQNRVAERKHKHILDVTRTVILQMNVPKSLWSDAVLTATHFINRMPSAPLGGEIPLRRLCPQRELFSLPPKVFGCVAYVQDLSPSLNKLAPRSLQCVFVGYSRTQKGYRCYHPPSRRYLVSADVTFWESKPYFDSFTSLPTSTGHITSTPLPVEIVDTGDVQRQPLQGNIPRPLQVYH